MPLLLVLKEIFCADCEPFTLAEIAARVSVIDETMNYQKIHRAYAFLSDSPLAEKVAPMPPPEYSQETEYSQRRVLFFSADAAARIARRALSIHAKKRLLKISQNKSNAKR